MMKFFLGCLLTVLVAANDWLYIDELEDLVSRNDRYLLKQLDDDEYTPRHQIQQQFNDILNRQTTQVQNAYRTLVAAKQRKDASEDAFEQQSAQSLGVGDIWNQLRKIETDLSLSEAQASQQKRQLYNSLSNVQRNLLHSIDD